VVAKSIKTSAVLYYYFAYNVSGHIVNWESALLSNALSKKLETNDWMTIPVRLRVLDKASMVKNK
jgi:hypothetical protein